jgi:GntP family gluconate:H+ symporter/Gnt-I system high-affinity gluconate transporter
LVEGCGPKGLPWALLGLSLLVGMPVFFEVGLVLLFPIIVEAARRSGRPPILVALPVLAGLSITHGLIPPHPSALLAAAVFHADLGRTILWGMAGAARALVAVLLPIALIFVGSWADSFTAPGGIPNQAMHMLGYPDVAMLLAVLVALVTLGSRIPREPHHGPDMLRKLTADSFVPIAGVLVILSAAGGLSGVLRESGAAQATVGLALGAHVPPLVLAWALAAVVRVCMGSSTVAMAVASGVLAPMAGHMGVRPEMLVLATGCGSLLLSHVNDSGFWLVGSLFKLDVKQTLGTWSVVETVLSVSGLGITQLLAAVVG